MKESIRRQNIHDEYYISEQCYITELSNSEDDPDISIARARVEPGVTTRWHRLKGISERYYILSGQGLAEVGELQKQEVTAGDVVLKGGSQAACFRFFRFDVAGFCFARFSTAAKNSPV